MALPVRLDFEAENNARYRILEELKTKNNYNWANWDQQVAWENLAEIRMRVGGLETMSGECSGTLEEDSDGWGTTKLDDGKPGIGGIWLSDPTGANIVQSPRDLEVLNGHNTNYIRILPNMTLRESHGDNYETVLRERYGLSHEQILDYMNSTGIVVIPGVCTR